MISVCLGCDKRHENCHAGCKEYKDEQAAHQAEKAERDKEKLAYFDIVGYIVEIQSKHRRGRFRK